MIKLGLIGKGTWGQNYIKTVRGIPECTIPNEYIKTTDYKDLFKKNDIHGVIIATPASTHFKIAKDLLKAGFNVLIEKPHTTSLKEANELIALQKKSNSIAMVGHVFVYHPAFWEMGNQCKKLGKIQYVHSEGMDMGPVRKDISAIWDWGPHDVSMCLNLFDKPLSVNGWNVRSKKSITEMCSIKINYKSFSVIMMIGWVSPVKKRSVTIVGESSSLIFDDTKVKKLRMVNNANMKVSYPVYKDSLPLTEEIYEFIKAIKTHKNAKTDLHHARDVIYILTSIEHSIKNNGKEVQLNF